MNNKNIHALIIGGGPAGVSAALYLARAGKDVCIIENGPGALARAHKIENYYGCTATGSELYTKGLEQARTLGASIIRDEVVSVDYTDCFELTCSNLPDTLKAPALILATGSKSVTLQLPGLAQLEGHGISYCAVCDGFFFRQKRVAVLGSGAYALHEADYLRHLAAKVVILTNGAEGKAFQAAGYKVITSPLTAAVGEKQLQAVLFADDSSLSLDGLFIALGTAGSTDIARKLGANTNSRFISINTDGATNIPGLFAAGDCTGGILQVTKAVYEGARAGLSAVRFLQQRG